MLAAWALLAALLFALVTAGWLPAGADVKPGQLERWAALQSLHATLRRESGALKDPLPVSESSLLAGANTYLANCRACHGAADGKPSAIARGLNVSVPQLAADGVEDDPEGETYWKVKHGIRFTGMPAFGSALSEEQIWQVTQFVAHLAHLPPAVEVAWKAMPSAALP